LAAAIPGVGKKKIKRFSMIIGISDCRGPKKNGFHQPSDPTIRKNVMGEMKASVESSASPPESRLLLPDYIAGWKINKYDPAFRVGDNETLFEQFRLENVAEFCNRMSAGFSDVKKTS